MAFSTYLPLITEGVKGLASGIFGAGDRKWKDQNRANATKYAGGLEGGITMADIEAMMPMLRKSISPLLKSVAGSSAAKYGSRSGLVLGAGMNAASQAMTPQIYQALMQRLMNNQMNLRQLYGSSMSAGSGSSGSVGI